MFTINPFVSIIYLIKLVPHGLQPQTHKNTVFRKAFQGLRAHLPKAGQGSVLKTVFSWEDAGFEQFCPSELTLPCMADCSSLYGICFFFLYCSNLSEHMARQHFPSFLSANHDCVTKIFYLTDSVKIAAHCLKENCFSWTSFVGSFCGKDGGHATQLQPMTQKVCV